jgi:Meiotically up-regulated gene 113
LTNGANQSKVVGPEGLAAISESKGLEKGLRNMVVLKRKGDFKLRTHPSDGLGGLSHVEYLHELLGAGGKNAVKTMSVANELNRQAFESPAAKGKVVYVVRAGEMVKIGKANDVKDRISVLQIGCPFPMEVLHLFEGYTELESKLHLKFKKFRSHGEWFHYSPKIRAFINKAKGPYSHLTEPELL